MSIKKIISVAAITICLIILFMHTILYTVLLVELISNRKVASKPLDSTVYSVPSYTRGEQHAISATRWLKNSLNNPNSLQVHSIQGCAKEDFYDRFEFHPNVNKASIDYLIKIDFSAQVPAGGYIRKTYYFALNSSSNLVGGGTNFINQPINQQAAGSIMAFSPKEDIDPIKVVNAIN